MQRKNTVANAKGKWPGILSHLGIDEKFLTGKHTECPMCGGTDRYRFANQEGNGCYFCSQCGSGFGIQLLQKFHGWTFAQAANEIDLIIGTIPAVELTSERTESEKVENIRKTLKKCQTVMHGDPVWLYLNRRVGITDIPPEIKYHPSMSHKDGGHHPCMIAILRDAEGKGTTLHRTYLTFSGEKANVSPVKMFMEGRRINGSAVRLTRLERHLGIAEGIENALAASVRFNLPVWAATNAILLEQWNLPAGVEEVSIFGDTDSSFTGQAAAYSLAKKLVRSGIKVNIYLPGEMDKDWADYEGK